MQRLPFAMGAPRPRPLIVTLTALLIALVAEKGAPRQAHAQSVPDGQSQAVITLAAGEGMAPFTAHVHALQSQLAAGDILTARFEWDFGDAGGTHNELVGWNAAHFYERPGEYLIRLRITDELGRKFSASTRVTIHPDDRQAIHVSPQGHDSNPGTRSAPVRTAARGLHLLGHDARLRFERGGRYDVRHEILLDRRNVVIDAYGDGELPVLRWVGVSGPYSIITMGGQCENVVIESLSFDSRETPTQGIVRAIRPNGANITVRRCHFDRISYAMNCELVVQKLLAENNDAEVIGGYFSWARGRDHVYLGNIVAGSVDEHNIRLGGCERVLIADNDLTSASKSTIWAMLGRHCYIAGNTLRRGRVIVGPNYITGDSGERFHFTVAEGNELLDEGFILYAGAEHAMLRNNVVRHNGGEAFSIWGEHQPMNRTCKDVSILHNTAINMSSQYGKFLKVGAGMRHLDVENNLYCAPNLNSQNGAANVHTDDPNLQSHRFRDNLWAVPAYGNYHHRLAVGGIGPPQWNAFSETRHERYHRFTGNDLDERYLPRFDPGAGASVPGVQVDFYGKKRKPNAPRIGAVE